MNEKIAEEDIIEADAGLQDFFDSLGPNDIYKMVFLEVLLEEIYGCKVDLSKAVNWDMQLMQKPSSPNQSPSTNLPDSPGAHGRPKT